MKKITNDRYFKDISKAGNIFEDYEGVEWDDFIIPSSMDVVGKRRDQFYILIDFLLNTKCYDSDHIT